MYLTLGHREFCTAGRSRTRAHPPSERAHLIGLLNQEESPLIAHTASHHDLRFTMTQQGCLSMEVSPQHPRSILDEKACPTLNPSTPRTIRTGSRPPSTPLFVRHGHSHAPVDLATGKPNRCISLFHNAAPQVHGFVASCAPSGSFEDFEASRPFGDTIYIHDTGKFFCRHQQLEIRWLCFDAATGPHRKRKTPTAAPPKHCCAKRTLQLAPATSTNPADVSASHMGRAHVCETARNRGFCFTHSRPRQFRQAPPIPRRAVHPCLGWWLR